MKREFYFQDAKSNMFWTIELANNAYVTTYGRIGSSGKQTRKEFATDELARLEFERQISAKLAKGYVEGTAPVVLADTKPAWSSMSMSEDVFWQIIGLFNWKKLGDDDAVVKPAVRALSQMTIEHIYRFEDILAEKLFNLDTVLHAQEIGQDAYREGKHFSVDWFLYARCVVVANGKKAYEIIRDDPKQMPKDCEFEALLSVGRLAYELKTGEEELDYSAPVSYETYSNVAGWRR